jgi:hypothetical protein
MAARSIAAMVLAVALIAVAGGPVAAGGDAVAPGFVEGREHEVRIRSVLGEVPPAPEKISRAARRASAAAVATCDPVQVAALRRVETTERDDDAPAACVVLPDGAGARADRSLLGAAWLTGSDFVTVAERKTSRGRRQLVLHLSPDGQRRWDGVAGIAGVGPLAFTLDGEIVEATPVQGDPRSSLADPPDVVVLGGDRGMPAARAKALVTSLRDARHETAIELGRTAGLTPLARTTYGRSHPRIYDKETLASTCTDVFDDATVAFGCYDGATIYVLRVDRPDLAGLMPVTAAHETLHASYQQLSRADRRAIDDLITEFLDTNPDAISHTVLADYGELGDAMRSNEAHSIVGTVERELPRALERHYAKYFEDRQELVDHFEHYQQVFDDLEATLIRLEGEAAALEGQLAALEGEVDAAGAEAERLFNEIESLRSQGRVEESNNLVDAQNAAVNRANSLVDQYNALVNQYNAKVAELNAASLVGQQLYQSLTPIEAPAG